MCYFGWLEILRECILCTPFERGIQIWGCVCLYILTWKCPELCTSFERDVQIWGCVCLSLCFDLEISRTVHTIWKRCTNLRLCQSVYLYVFTWKCPELCTIFEKGVQIWGCVFLSVCFDLEMFRTVHTIRKRCKNLRMCLSVCQYVLTWKCLELFTPFERGVQIWGCVSLSACMFWLGNVQNCAHHLKEVYKFEDVSVCLYSLTWKCPDEKLLSLLWFFSIFYLCQTS